MNDTKSEGTSLMPDSAQNRRIVSECLDTMLESVRGIDPSRVIGSIRFEVSPLELYGVTRGYEARVTVGFAGEGCLGGTSRGLVEKSQMNIFYRYSPETGWTKLPDLG